MSDILPVFSTHYSIGQSILTLEEPGKAKPGNPISVFDMAAEGKLSHVVVVDDRIDGFLQAYKVASKMNVTLCYGVKLKVCATMADKTPESRRTESSVIVFIADGAPNQDGIPQGYADLIRIWNRAWGKEGHFKVRLGGDDIAYGRADWDLLNEYWTPNLTLALPFFSSFIARNALTFHQITPRLPVEPVIFQEQDSGLPFAHLIDLAIQRYNVVNPLTPRLATKTIYYRDRAAFRAYLTFRAIDKGGIWDEPGVDHLCSDSFCWESYKELFGAPLTVTA